MIVYTILIFLILFFGLRYLKVFRVSQLSDWTMPAAFAVKSVVGLIFLYLYTYILGNGTLGEDAGLFIRESKILHDVFYQSPTAYFKFLTGIGESQDLIEQYLADTTRWDIGTQTLLNDNKNILRLHSIIHFFSMGIPAVHAMILILLSLIGVKQLYLAVSCNSKAPKQFIFWGILLLPGLIFWSSSVLKEPLMLLGLGLLIRALLRKDHLNKRLLYFALGLIILLGFKSYVLFAMIPMLVFFGLTAMLSRYRMIGALGGLLFIITILFSAIPSLREKAIKTVSRRQFDFTNVARGGMHVFNGETFYYFEPKQLHLLEVEGDSVTLKKDTYAQILKLGQLDKPEKISVKASNTKWFIYFSNRPSNGFIDVTPVGESYARLFQSIPEALINALLRPLPGDPGSAFNYMAIFETFIVFGMLFWAIFRKRKLTEQERIYVVGLILFALFLALMIGWTTSVLGAIARYRLPVYLAIVLISGIVWGPKKMNQHE